MHFTEAHCACLGPLRQDIDLFLLIFTDARFMCICNVALIIVFPKVCLNMNQAQVPLEGRRVISIAVSFL